MAGIYIHIPFCKQACHYCDFHFSTNQKYVNEMTDALCDELKFQSEYLNGESIATIYFGGGTPSLLNDSQLKRLFETISNSFSIPSEAEITLEANPDDLSIEKLNTLINNGINRLSIGVQSFDENTLTFLNRVHNRHEAIQCFTDARAVGFDNINLDLIYAIPGKNNSKWSEDLDEIVHLAPEHISAYCLTIEDNTVFGRQMKHGSFPSVEEEIAAQQFETLVKHLCGNHYEQYEVSNFCKPKKYSRHNTNYWKQKPYLGIGPGAHSYNGLNRQFNISNNARYMSSIAKGEIPAEMDFLTKENKINEYLMTTLRTKWGADLEYLKRKHGYDLYQRKYIYLNHLIDNEYAVFVDNTIRLTSGGLLLADKISSDLFMDGK